MLTAFYYQKVWAFHLLGKLDDALDWLRYALALQPNNFSVLTHLAAALADQGQLREAHELYTRAISLPGVKLKTVSQYRSYVTRAYSSKPPALIAAYLDIVLWAPPAVAMPSGERV